jgi:nucleoid-associated protein YgaU
MPGASMEHSGRLAGGFALLVLLWIVVYWWWEPAEPPIRFQPVPAESAPAPRPVDPLPPSPAPMETPKALPPPETPGVVRAVVTPEFTEYTVVPGDTFERIARKQLGSSAKAGLIARANPFVDPSRLKPGRTLRIPRDPENISGKTIEIAGRPPADPANTYTVESGDTLSGISQRLYGESKYADLIFQANRDKLASKNDLKIGQSLIIPPKPQP